MSSKDWNRYLDDITFADVEYEDIQRITKNLSKGIDSLDAEKVMADLCSLRYRFGFLYMAIKAILFVARPKECIQKSIVDIGKAAKTLEDLKKVMEEASDEFDDEEEDFEHEDEKYEDDEGDEEEGFEEDDPEKEV